MDRPVGSQPQPVPPQPHAGQPQPHPGQPQPRLQAPQPVPFPATPVSAAAPTQLKPPRGRLFLVRNGMWVAAGLLALVAAGAFVARFAVIPPQVERAKAAIAQSEADEDAARARQAAAEEELASLEALVEEIE